MKVRSWLLFIVFILILYSCSERPITKDFEKIYGFWQLERIKYSNSTTYPSNPLLVYVFTANLVVVTNNTSNYLGVIQEIYSNATNFISNTWNLDLVNNLLSVNIDITNFSYVINFVAVDSTDVNYIWLMEGKYSISNTNYYFFISNNVEMYILKKIQ